MTAVSVPAFAKLNLGLRVLCRRTDGYHELRTVFQTISLADSIEITFTPALTTEIKLDGMPEVTDNLVERACHLVMLALEIQAHVRFTIKKNIPIGSGLGGGSSDAAAILLALPVLAGKSLRSEQLHEIATGLGSDVPFFLHGGTALGSGRGEELYPLPDRTSTQGLLVAPGIHSSTTEAYQDLSPQLTSIGLQNKLFSFQQEVWQEGESIPAENDFEEVVFARYPELKAIKQRLYCLGARPAAMTGSGSAIFGIFADTEQLSIARKSFPDHKVFAISFLSRAQYHSAWKRALHPYAEDNLWPPRSLYARNQPAL